jgi:hypothetical protein
MITKRTGNWGAELSWYDNLASTQPSTTDSIHITDFTPIITHTVFKLETKRRKYGFEPTKSQQSSKYFSEPWHYLLPSEQGITHNNFWIVAEFFGDYIFSKVPNDIGQGSEKSFSVNKDVFNIVESMYKYGGFNPLDLAGWRCWPNP